MVNQTYPKAFRGNILRSTQYLLEAVAESGPLLKSAERKQCLHVLTFGLALPVGWALSYKLLLLIAPKVEQSGHWGEWIPCLQQGVVQSQRLADVLAEGALRLHLAQFYQLGGNLQAATEMASAAQNCFAQVVDAEQEGVAFVLVAILKRLQGEYGQAQIQLDRAACLVSPGSVAQARCFHAQASLFLDQQQFTLAAALYRSACKLFETHGETKRSAWAMQGIANALSLLGEYDEAIGWSKQAIELFIDVGDLISVAITQLNMGTIYDLQDEPQDALVCYRLAEPIFRRVQHRYNLGVVLHNQGRAYRGLSDWELAEQAFLQSSAIWREIGNTDHLVNSLDDLGLLYYEVERIEESITTFEEALAVVQQIDDLDKRAYRLEEVTRHLQIVAAVGTDDND